MAAGPRSDRLFDLQISAGMNADDVLGLPSLPMASPSCPVDPYRFIDRECLIVSYQSDRQAVRVALREPLMEKMSATQVNFKLTLDVDGSLLIAQRVACEVVDIRSKAGWSGPTRLHPVPHVDAPLADLPVRKVFGGLHFIADLTLPYGRVTHNHNRNGNPS